MRDGWDEELLFCIWFVHFVFFIYVSLGINMHKHISIFIKIFSQKKKLFYTQKDKCDDWHCCFSFSISFVFFFVAFSFHCFKLSTKKTKDRKKQKKKRMCKIENEDTKFPAVIVWYCKTNTQWEEHENRSHQRKQ